MVEDRGMIRREKDAWNPFGLLKNLEDELDVFRRGFEDMFSFPASEMMSGMRTPLLDVKDQGENYTVLAEMPGIKKDKIDITVKDNVLEISGKEEEKNEEEEKNYVLRERRSSEFHRAVRIPDEVDPKKIQANMKDGMLKITIPKSEEKKLREHKIKVD